MNPSSDHAIFGAPYRPASGQYDNSKALPVMLERVLDMLDSALLIVDDEGRVEYRNCVASTLLARGHGGLTLTGGALSAKVAKVRDALAQAIRLACDGLQPSGLCLPQPGTPPERWLRMVVAPVYFGGAAGGASRAAVWILNTEAPALPSEELLSALFGLSRAEARLAIGLLDGAHRGGARPPCRRRRGDDPLAAPPHLLQDRRAPPGAARRAASQGPGGAARTIDSGRGMCWNGA